MSVRAPVRKSGGWIFAAIVGVLAAPEIVAAAEQECRLHSPAHRVTVIELYTSEGCNSCPPVDRWFNALRQQGIAADMAVLLAFHVDYWNELGWPDRFSKPSFSQRQRAVAARTKRGFVYTPQLVLDGLDYRHRYRLDRLRDQLGAINAERGQASIEASVIRNAAQLRITGRVHVPAVPPAGSVHAWIAVFENGLSTRVTAGENAGKRLYHDHVVRALAGPFPIGSDQITRFEHRIELAPDWNRTNVGVAIYAERTDTGHVLAAGTLYPLCP